MNLFEKFKEAGLLTEAQIKAHAAKQHEIELRKKLKKIDILGIGYCPKVKTSGIDIPRGNDAQHSWASMDGSTVHGTLAVVRDGEVVVIDFNNDNGYYSSNGNVTESWSNQWFDQLKVGDIIIAYFFSLERYFQREESEFTEEYYILREPYVFEGNNHTLKKEIKQFYKELFD